MKDRIEHLQEALDRHVRMRDEELRKLCKSPDMLAIAQALTDALVGNLTYLCNFAHLVDGFGKNVEVVEVIARLEKDIYATFRHLAGEEYQPSIVRAVDFARKEKPKTN